VKKIRGGTPGQAVWKVKQEKGMEGKEKTPDQEIDGNPQKTKGEGIPYTLSGGKKESLGGG